MSKIDQQDFIAPDPFVLTVNVGAADIDDFGHVNNVVYLGWIARGMGALPALALTLKLIGSLIAGLL